MRAGLALLTALLGGCAAGPPELATAVPTVTVGGDDEPVDGGPVLERLAREPVEGLCMVRADAVLFPSAAAARRGPVDRGEAHDPRALHVLADEGDVVKVRTWHSPRVRKGVEPLTSSDLTLYAHRSQLRPVLRTPLQRTFADGTGYLLEPGLVVDVGVHLRPADPSLRRLDITLPSRVVALSIPLRGEDAKLDAEQVGEELACDRQGGFEREETRIYSAAERRERQRARRLRELEERGEQGVFGLGRIGAPWSDFPTCTLVGVHDRAGAREQLRLDGRSVVRAVDVGGDRCSFAVRAFRAPSPGKVLVSVRYDRARLRLAADESALREVGGCGAVGMGSLGTLGRRRAKPKPPPQVWAAVGKTKVYFPDGRHAGYHMSGTTPLRSAVRRGGSYCIDHPNLTTQLCFRRSDLERVPLRRSR